ncbi:VIT1/CCC1 transporter family protein [Patescibacteria group bacterium]|nr:VIT1/CCC1 transporter family protein [Patescibacteria group bacterium]
MNNHKSLQQRYKEHQKSDVHGLWIREYVRDIVFGGNDGIVTTFAVVAGTIGAQLPHSVVIILGAANLLADGLSMATGTYLSLRSEHDKFQRLRKEELKEIEDDPEIEAEEVRQAYRAKGFEGTDLEKAVSIITADKERWANVMMHEEHGLTEEASGKPALHGFLTFISFVIFGSIPLLPFVFGVTHDSRFTVAIISTFCALVLLGIARSYLTKERLIRGPIEIVSIGALGAFAAFGVGVLLKNVVGTVI